jgi:DNA helicase-2/ATP-dependent DNA helicase PcrA
MSEKLATEGIFSSLNPQQRCAVEHGNGPLLIVAGAGTGKTATLVHRVAWLISCGVPPERILLLTFTRRASAEMLRRVDGVLRRLRESGGSASPVAAEKQAHVGRVWGGTFHAIAARLLRQHGNAIGLPPEFTIHDRADSEDLLNVVRTELGLAKTDRRFPKKGTCMAIYSRCVNARQNLDEVLSESFPWCREWADELKQLFDAYVDHKEAAAVLDYDDLLVYWHALLGDPKVGDRIRSQFQCVLVDEYQDTNLLQAEILYQLSPDGMGMTAVGDDAQSIYSFRAATVRNILDFPKRYPDATVVTLEQNYRSSQPILDATNQVIGQAKERFTKNLWSEQKGGDLPLLVTCEDENDQSDYLVAKILEHREAGIDLRRQAVLFRASHHSILLEAELSRRNVPFHKYGGLKFIETAHVKDLLAILRLAENPRDLVSGARLLALLPGIGPHKARQLMGMLPDSVDRFSAWQAWTPPAATREIWPKFVALIEGLSRTKEDLPAQVHRAREFYTPLLEQCYDNPIPRARDLEQIELIASRYSDRRSMLADITLDPPSSTQDLAGSPRLDEDYLILSTIHSAKGLEWDCVYVIHAADGNIPSDMATGSPEGVEEERRLFYVALTRAKRWLYVCYPLRYYRSGRKFASAYGYAQASRFLPQGVVGCFQRTVASSVPGGDDPREGTQAEITSQGIRERTKRFWG